MTLNNAGRTLCVYTGKRPVVVEDSCIYYGDDINRNFINSKPFSYLSGVGLASKNATLIDYNTIDFFSLATDEDVKSYLKNKLTLINSVSVKYYDVTDETLPVTKSYSFNKTQLNQIINNQNTIIEFNRGETYIDYSIKLSEYVSISMYVSLDKTISGVVTELVDTAIVVDGDLSVYKGVEIREICQNLTENDNIYLTSDYNNFVDFSNAPQEAIWKNAQLTSGQTRTLTTRLIYGYDNTGGVYQWL